MKYDPGPCAPLTPVRLMRRRRQRASLPTCCAARENAQLRNDAAVRPLRWQGSIPPAADDRRRVRSRLSQKAKTRWEKFAESGGIVKKKRSKMVWTRTRSSGRHAGVRPRQQSRTIRRIGSSKRSRRRRLRRSFEARDEKKLKVDNKKRQESATGSRRHVASIGAGSGGGAARRCPAIRRGQEGISQGCDRGGPGSTASMGRFDKALKYEPTRRPASVSTTTRVWAAPSRSAMPSAPSRTRSSSRRLVVQARSSTGRWRRRASLRVRAGRQGRRQEWRQGRQKGCQGQGQEVSSFRSRPRRMGHVGRGLPPSPSRPVESTRLLWRSGWRRGRSSRSRHSGRRGRGNDAHVDRDFCISD